MVEYDETGDDNDDNASESSSVSAANCVNQCSPSGAPSADRFKLTYKCGNVVYEMVPMNSPTPEPPDPSAYPADECSHISTRSPSERIVPGDDLMEGEPGLGYMPADCDHLELDRLDHNSVQFDEQEASLSASELVFGDSIPEAQPDPSKVQMYGPLRQQHERANDRRTMVERSGMPSSPPPANTSPDSRRQTSPRQQQREEIGAEVRKGSLPEGRTAARKPKKSKEKSVKHSYLQKEEGLALKPVNDILVALGEILPFVDGLAPNGNTVVPLQATAGTRKTSSKTKGSAGSRRKNLLDNGAENGVEVRRIPSDGSTEEVEVPLELDPDITRAQRRGEDDTSSAPRFPDLGSTERSSSPPSTTTNSIAAPPTDDNSAADTNVDVVVESVGITFLLLRNPFVQFTRQQLRQMADKEKKARWLYNADAPGEALPLPSVEECEQEWKLLKRNWDDFLHKGEKPSFYRDAGGHKTGTGALKDKPTLQRQNNAVRSASNTNGGRRFNRDRGSSNYAR